MSRPNSVPFSPAGRTAALAEMASSRLDLLVIGGGITGAGLARDAALRGLRVGLVEARDFGCGTSSRSTKIIHGGIRYLQYLHLGLVRESARERWVLRRIAPHLIHPLRFVYPLYPGMPTLKYRFGFWLFDQLAGASGDEAHRMLSVDDTRRLVPGLRDELRGAGLYPEFVTDDARLTLENALSAALNGALVANHAEVADLLVYGGRVRGARVRDTLADHAFEVEATVIVNATGVWSERTLALAGAEAPSHILPSKGIHLLFRHDRFPLESASHVRASSGREGLAIRRGEFVYVGTSDIEYRGSYERPLADEAAIADVLAMTRDCFRGLELTRDDVIGTWAGIRPLIAEPGKSTRETSRKDEVWETPDGLITVAGGKLTTYRAMAHRVMDRVVQRLDVEPGPDRSADVPLPGADAGAEDPGDIADAAVSALRDRGVADAALRRIAWVYGARARRLLDYGEQDPAWLDPIAPGTPALRAEVRLAIDEEMALDLEDVLDRRLSLLLFSEDHGLAAAEPAARILADRLGWTDARRHHEVTGYRELARGHSGGQGSGGSEAPAAEGRHPNYGT
ncbi:MAG: glycerol-3-phosphate dehydrogenase/oxidase [Longimicrobiales bacterium]